MKKKLQTFQWPACVFTRTVMPAMAAVEGAIFLKGKFYIILV